MLLLATRKWLSSLRKVIVLAGHHRHRRLIVERMRAKGNVLRRGLEEYWKSINDIRLPLQGKQKLFGQMHFMIGSWRLLTFWAWIVRPKFSCLDSFFFFSFLLLQKV